MFCYCLHKRESVHRNCSRNVSCFSTRTWEQHLQSNQSIFLNYKVYKYLLKRHLGNTIWNKHNYSNTWLPAPHTYIPHHNQKTQEYLGLENPEWPIRKWHGTGGRSSLIKMFTHWQDSLLHLRSHGWGHLQMPTSRSKTCTSKIPFRDCDFIIPPNMLSCFNHRKARKCRGCEGEVMMVTQITTFPVYSWLQWEKLHHQWEWGPTPEEAVRLSHGKD